MWGNTLPLPPELVEETLYHCGSRELFALAQTSRELYVAAVHVLAARGEIPLSLPQSNASTSGMIEALKSSKAYDMIDTVSIDVTKRVWRKYQNVQAYMYYTPLYQFLSSRPMDKKIKLRFCTRGNGGCDLAALNQILTRVMTIANGRFDNLVFHIAVDDQDQVVVENELMLSPRRAFAHRRRLDPRKDLKPIESLDLRIRATDARNVAQCFLDLGIDMVISTKQRVLQNLKVVVDWKDSKDIEARYRWEHLDFRRLRQVPQLKTLYFEDKKSALTSDYVNQFIDRFPNIEEIHLDTGVSQRMSFYRSLSHLGKLRKLSIPFPYHDPRVMPQRTREINTLSPACCMRSEMWRQIKELAQTHLISKLEELVFHYLSNDAQTTNYTKISFDWHEENKKEVGNEVVEGQQGEEEEGEEENSDNVEHERQNDLGGGQPGLASTAEVGVANGNPATTPSESVGQPVEATISNDDSESDYMPFTISMEDLGDKPTHPSDLTEITSLLLRQDKETGLYHLREGIWTAACKFLVPWLQEMIGEDALRATEILTDDKCRNQRGTKCSNCGF
ncbi:hypothetical protein ABW21_db0209239 [Orbilia brochopaga]|nr:hypothetical protein ABW21_db0209239 [Drechslerella brochopaga]